MGLDIYLYRLRKSNLLEEGSTYNRSDLVDIANHIVTIEPDDPSYNCKTIQNIGTKITVIERVYDKDKVAEKAGVDGCEYMYRTSESFGKTHHVIFSLFDKDDNEIGSCLIDDKDAEDVLVDCQIEYIAFESEEVDYQRKGLTSCGWDLMPENCVYDDDFERINEMTKHGLSNSFIDNWVEGETVLLCWW